jgi:hypothetical protein
MYALVKAGTLALLVASRTTAQRGLQLRDSAGLGPASPFTPLASERQGTSIIAAIRLWEQYSTEKQDVKSAFARSRRLERSHTER